jgi:hypothetical protein
MNTRAASRSILVAVVLALAAPSSAFAGATLSIAGPSAASVGQPLLLHGNGTVPDLQYSYWFSAHVIPAAVLATCPSDHYEAWQIAVATGGAYITHAQRETADSAGNFTIPFGLTPWAPGDFIVCAYTDDGYTNTLARAQLNLHVTGAAPAVAKPANASTPRVTRTARRLVCKPGRWLNAPTAYAYQWLVDGKAGREGRRLAVTRRLRGHKVRCRVTASNAGGAATALSRTVRVSRAPRHRSSLGRASR